MHSLAVVFPPDHFTLLFAIVALPLLGAFINGVFGKRLGPEAVSLMALSAVGGSFVLSVVSFLMLANAESEPRNPNPSGENTPPSDSMASTC